MTAKWVAGHFRYYLWGRNSIFVTDCSAITWLFKVQSLSFKLDMWDLRMMGDNMKMQWRLGAPFQLQDALLFRLPRFESRGEGLGNYSPKFRRARIITRAGHGRS